MRYYNGVATLGEIVICRREPSNQVCTPSMPPLAPLQSRLTLAQQYDSNAIRVDNVFGVQIGVSPAPKSQP